MRRRTELLSFSEKAVTTGDLFSRTSAKLRRVVPYDSAVWAATDPETGLITAPMIVENLGSGERCAEYWESELLEENVIPFRDLARSPMPAAGLRAVTGDLPARSARFRRLLGGQNVGDELRAVLRTGDRPWGVVSLFRARGEAAFGAEEIELLAGLSAPLAERLRRFARPSAPDGAAPDASAPGMVLFDDAGEATSINDEARHYLSLLPDGPSVPSVLGVSLPIWIVGTALQARAVAGGRSRDSARVRIRTVDGRWLTCHASCLRGPGGHAGPVALVIEPAAASDRATMIAEAYGLTPRELEITQLLARGLSTAEIATGLSISPHTVRDHLKAVFAKAEVSSRGELVARVFAEHYWPRITRSEAFTA